MPVAVEPRKIRISSEDVGSTTIADFHPGTGASALHDRARRDGIADTSVAVPVFRARTPKQMAHVLYTKTPLILNPRDGSNALLPASGFLVLASLAPQAEVPYEMWKAALPPWRDIPIAPTGGSPASQRNPDFNQDIRLDLGVTGYIFDEDVNLFLMVRSSVALAWANSYLEFELTQMPRERLQDFDLTGMKYATEV